MFFGVRSNGIGGSLPARRLSWATSSADIPTWNLATWIRVLASELRKAFGLPPALSWKCRRMVLKFSGDEVGQRRDRPDGRSFRHQHRGSRVQLLALEPDRCRRQRTPSACRAGRRRGRAWPASRDRRRRPCGSSRAGRPRHTRRGRAVGYDAQRDLRPAGRPSRAPRSRCSGRDGRRRAASARGSSSPAIRGTPRRWRRRPHLGGIPLAQRTNWRRRPSRRSSRLSALMDAISGPQAGSATAEPRPSGSIDTGEFERGDEQAADVGPALVADAMKRRADRVDHRPENGRVGGDDRRHHPGHRADARDGRDHVPAARRATGRQPR